eukprot:jgi/Hompol1/1083/HPOL_001379-RA
MSATATTIFKIKAIEDFIAPSTGSNGGQNPILLSFREGQPFYALSSDHRNGLYFVSTQFATPFARTAVSGLVPMDKFIQVDLMSRDAVRFAEVMVMRQMSENPMQPLQPLQPMQASQMGHGDEFRIKVFRESCAHIVISLMRISGHARHDSGCSIDQSSHATAASNSSSVAINGSGSNHMLTAAKATRSHQYSHMRSRSHSDAAIVAAAAAAADGTAVQPSMGGAYHTLHGNGHGHGRLLGSSQSYSHLRPSAQSGHPLHPPAHAQMSVAPSAPTATVPAGSADRTFEQRASEPASTMKKLSNASFATLDSSLKDRRISSSQSSSTGKAPPVSHAHRPSAFIYRKVSHAHGE